MDLRDVTIREANQMPEREYSVEQRVAVGAELDVLGFNEVQAGFPAVGPDHAAVIEELAYSIDADVSALARALHQDIDAAIGADADAVDVMIPISDVQLNHVVGKPFRAMQEQLVDIVDSVQAYGAAVTVTAMDAFRAPPERIASLDAELQAEVCLNLADTVGCCTPSGLKLYLRRLSELSIDPSRIGVHFHNDLGVATANTVLAREFGVGRADVSVAATGERAGNAPLEEVVVAAAVDGNPFDVQASKLVVVCTRILEILGEDVHERKPILGSGVTTHESGLHTAAMLTDPSTFEAFDPEAFGGDRTLLFGRQTGEQGVRKLVEYAGHETSQAVVERVRDRLRESGGLDLDAAIELVDRTVDERVE